jgi:hypothetical protein
VLAISIIEVSNDGGAFANEHLVFSVYPNAWKKVLAVPRCNQVKKGTQDRTRINDKVAERYTEVGNTTAMHGCTVGTAGMATRNDDTTERNDESP